LDLTLPDSFGLETFFKMQAEAPHLPIVVLTGVNDEELALEAVQRGAQDYLVKGHVNGDLLERALCYAIERKRAEEVLQKAPFAAASPSAAWPAWSKTIGICNDSDFFVELDRTLPPVWQLSG
jgi:DNA-binding NarL/FixJ family response regulator